MGYLKNASVKELKEFVNAKVAVYNFYMDKQLKVLDIYKVPKVNFEWDRIIAKVDNNGKEEIISIRPFAQCYYFGFELINYSEEKVYMFSNKNVGVDYKFDSEVTLADYLKEKSTDEFIAELNLLINNIKNNNIKKRIARN